MYIIYIYMYVAIAIYIHCIDTCIATCHYMYHGYNIGIHICVPCTAFCHLELPFFFRKTDSATASSTQTFISHFQH